MATSVTSVTTKRTGNVCTISWKAFTGSKKSRTDHITAHWYYQTVDSKGRYIDATKDSVGAGASASTFTAPDGATYVKVVVTPVAKKHKSGKTEKAYYSGKSVKRNFDPPADKPSRLSVPTIDTRQSGEQNRISVSTSDVNAYKVEFQWRWYIDEMDESGSFASSFVEASFEANVSGGRAERPWKNCYYGRYITARARAVNKAGRHGDWSDWSELFTPKPMGIGGGVSLSAESESSIGVSWYKSASTRYKADSWEVAYYSDDGTGSTSNPDWKTSTVDRSAYWTVLSGLGQNKRYHVRVRGVSSKSTITGEKVYGAWSDIKTIMIGTVPEAPSTYQLYDTVVAGESNVLGFVHNSEDESECQGAEIQFPGGELPTWIDTSAPVDGTHTVDGSSTGSIADGASVSWKARTKGFSSTWSEWSEVRTFRVFEQPEATLTLLDKDGGIVGGGLMVGYPLVAVGTVASSSQSPVSWSLVIETAEDTYYTDVYGEEVVLPSGSVVYSKTVGADGGELRLVLDVGDVDLAGSSSYAARLTVAMDSGLSDTTDDVTFGVDWGSVDIPDPDAAVELVGSSLMATVTPTCADEYGNLAEDVSLAVYRLNADRTITKLADGLANDGSNVVVDPHPPLVNASYRIVATKNGTRASTFVDTPEMDMGSPYIVINWNDGVDVGYAAEGDDELTGSVYTGSMLVLPYDVSIQEDSQKDVSLVQYIGRESPVGYSGTQRGRTASWTSNIVKRDFDTLNRLRELQSYMGDVYVREPYGGGYWANVDVSFSTSYDTMKVPVTLTITKVEHEDVSYVGNTGTEQE